MQNRFESVHVKQVYIHGKGMMINIWTCDMDKTGCRLCCLNMLNVKSLTGRTLGIAWYVAYHATIRHVSAALHRGSNGLRVPIGCFYWMHGHLFLFMLGREGIRTKGIK